MGKWSTGASWLVVGLVLGSAGFVIAQAEDPNNLMVGGPGPHYIKSGNVGVGTTGPKGKLDVRGNTFISGKLSVQGGAEVAGHLHAGTAPASPAVITQTGGITPTDTLVAVSSTAGYPAAGVLLIDAEAMGYTGTTASSFTGLTRGFLGTSAAAHAANTNVDNYLAMLGGTNTNPVASPTPRMVVTGTGNVGIGTTTPVSKLQVDHGYLQIDYKALGDPPPDDCNATSQAGRMILELSLRWRLWVCSGAHGWKYIPLTTPTTPTSLIN